MRRFLINAGVFCVVLVCFTTPVFSQTDNNAALLPEIIRSSRFDGVIKTKLETSVENGVMRFNVRNSRVGVRGDIGEYVSYRVLVELSNEGVFQPLDLFGTLKPTKNLSILFGQQNIPFDNAYIIAPGELMFANRAFLGKFFTPGTRDMGAVVQYRFRIGNFPMEGQAGMFNGGVINQPRWTDKPSFALRLIAGSMTGFRTTAKVYRYNREQQVNTQALNNLYIAADARYANNKMRIETEVMNRHSYITGLDLFGTYIQGAYTFDMPNKEALIRTLSPAARLDAMGYDVFNSGFDVTRFTVGLNFGLTFLPFDSILRIDYEQYFVQKGLDFPDFVYPRDDYVTDNKVTIELIVKF